MPPSSRRGCRESLACTRTQVLRLTLVSSLLVAAVACAVLSYIVLSDTERDVGVYAYESIAASALINARSITMRKVQGSEVMATVLSYEVRNASQWPFIRVDGYIPIASAVAALSASTTQSLMVFVDPEEATSFEEHTQQVYKEQGRPEDAGVNEFGFGIWKNDPETNQRVHDISGETDWNGPSKILAPLMMHHRPGAGSLMYNVYSEADRGIQLESMFDCVARHDDPSVSPSCTAITDMLELKVRPGPAGLLFRPIFPVNDPEELVGFATTSIHWEEVLQNVVPNYVDGLICVVSTDTASYTYEIREGVPLLVGPGDLHSGFEEYKRSVVLNDFIETGVETSAVYTLTIYPTQELLDIFTTASPLAVAFGFLGVILLCMCLFFLYDYLMRHEAHQRKIVMDMKRRFVRFISHEIRTPLNTVCMGLDLLSSEISPGSKRRNANSDGCADSKDMDFWHSVLVDAKANSDIAVNILSDLLDFDKIESGTMLLEMNRVDIWELLETTTSLFNIQALNRKINLDLDLNDAIKNRSTSNFSRTETADTEVDVEQYLPSEVNVFGDDLKLGQVIRNLLSNALKFTPEGGSITITTSYDEKGLPHVQAPQSAKNNEFGHARRGSIKIAVADSGVGLSQEQLGQLFNEGIQFDPNKLQHGGGSGLGLHIAKGIVEGHGGTIVASSPGIGQGTTFTVELPLFEFPQGASKCISPSNQDKVSPCETERTSDDLQQSRRILVVEDSDSSRKMFIRLLERSGMSCIPAANGEEAITCVRKDLDASKEDPEHVPIDTIMVSFAETVYAFPTQNAISQHCVCSFSDGF